MRIRSAYKTSGGCFIVRFKVQLEFEISDTGLEYTGCGPNSFSVPEKFHSSNFIVHSRIFYNRQPLEQMSGKFKCRIILEIVLTEATFFLKSN